MCTLSFAGHRRKSAKTGGQTSGVCRVIVAHDAMNGPKRDSKREESRVFIRCETTSRGNILTRSPLLWCLVDTVYPPTVPECRNSSSSLKMANCSELENWSSRHSHWEVLSNWTRQFTSMFAISLTSWWYSEQRSDSPLHRPCQWASVKHRELGEALYEAHEL